MRKRELLTLLAAAIVMLALAAAPVMADLASGVTLDFNANDSASGVSSSSWVSLTADQSRNWSFGGDVSLVDASSGLEILKAYRFTGGSGANASSWTNYDESADATWELWVKPAGTGSGNQVIFESGGGGTGMAIYYDQGAGTVNFRIDGGTPVGTVSAPIGTEEFSHVVCVYDKDFNANDLMQIWVNGVLVDEYNDNSGIDKWSGTDGAGLGHVNTGIASNMAAGSFYGDLAVLRFWEAKALTEAEVTGNYALYASFGAEIIYPENGAVVPPGEVMFEWINLDPNGATETYVDVWFGTDPNKVTGPGAGTYTKVVNGESISSFAVTPDGPGVYYWQVDSYTHGKPTTAGGTVDYSSGDPCMVAGGVNMFTNDGPIASVDAGPDMVTWVGEVVDLVAGVDDDGGSALTYSWTMDLPSGVTAVIDPSADVAVTSVTFAKGPYTNANIVNAGFEAETLGEDGWGGSPGWTQIGRMGNWNPPVDAYDGSAVPEGVMCAWAQTVDGGLSQVLTETLAADTDYTLTVEVGNSNRYDWTGYKVQLLAGGVVIAEDDNTVSPALGTFATSMVNYSYAPEDANKVGLPLEIRLLAGSLAPGYAECNFDAVQLSADPAFPTPEGAVTVDVTATVNDELNPAVSDTVTIEIYDDACQAARLGLGLDAEADYDESCLIDVADLATMAGQWLDDTSATEAAVNPVQPDGKIVINGDFQTILHPDTLEPCTIPDGLYFGIPGMNVKGGGVVTYADGTTGDSVYLPGWVVAEGSKTNADIMQGGDWGGPEGSGDMALLCFAGWGGPTYVESAAPLSLPTRGPGVEYELSCDIFTNGGPVVLELRVDGVALTPDTESSPALIAGEWVEYSRTFSSVPEGDVTVLVGTRDDAGTGWTGNRASIDNVELTFTMTDPAAPSVDAGVDMVTWLGEPVQLAPIVEPNELLDPQPVLVYNWTAETLLGYDVSISDPSIEAPAVTVTKVPYWWEVTIKDPSFEDVNVGEDGQRKWFGHGQTTPWCFPDQDGTAALEYYGVMYRWNPQLIEEGGWTGGGGMLGEVPDGVNCVALGTYLSVGDPALRPEAALHDTGLAQVLDVTYDPSGTYELSTYIGHSGLAYSNYYGYKVELLAGGTVVPTGSYTDKVFGGTVIGSLESTDPIDPNTWELVTVTVDPNPANADLAGEPLQVRITSLRDPADPTTSRYIMVDNVKLMTDAPPALESIELMLSVNNEGSSTIVSDTVTIDVYENACEVIKAVDPSAIDNTDHNIDCTTNLLDFEVLAADWLVDYSLTGSVAK